MFRTCKKSKQIEACISSSKLGIGHVLVLFQLTAPAQTNGNNLKINSQNNEVNNEIDSWWHKNTLENK